MPDVEANIILNTTGGDESASEIQKATGAINNVTSASGGLQAKFQERFQHIGLSIFAGQALESIGLSGETRQAVMLMNTALMGIESAAGISTGGLTLLLTAMVAIGVAAYKVIQGEKDQTAELLKQASQMKESAAATGKEIEALEAWKTSAGKLPPALQAVLDADERLRQQQIKSTETTNQQVIASINLRIAKEADMVASDKAATSQLQTSMENLAKYLKPGMEGYTMLERTTASYQKSVKQLQTDTTALGTDQATLNRTIAEQIQLLHGNTTAITDQSAAAIAANAKRKADTLAMDEAMKEKDEAYNASVRSQMDKTIEGFNKGQLQEQKNLNDSLKKQEQAVRAFSNKVGSSFATMFNSMIFDGKKFSQAFDSMMKSLAEDFIKQIIEMTLQHAIQSALRSTETTMTVAEQVAATASGATATTSIWTAMTTTMLTEWEILKAAIMSNPYTAASEPAAAQSTYTADSSIASTQGYKGAVGGQMMVDSPTMFMAGDNGPEIASFTPMSGSTNGGSDYGGGGGGGEGTQVNNITINVQGGLIDQTTLNKIGKYIVQTIRGQGQLDFTRV